MTQPVPVPLFLGPVELMLVGAVILVLIFGSKATDIARDAGSAAGKVNKTRRTARQEIDEVKGEFEEGVEPIQEEVEAVEQEVEAVEKDIEAVEEELPVDDADASQGAVSRDADELGDE